MTTIESLTIQLAETQDALDKARKSRKATSGLKVRVADLEAAIAEAEAAVETVTEVPETPKPKGKAGRPRKYASVHYEVRESLSLGKRGRPSREVLLHDAKTLMESDPLVKGVSYTKDPSLMTYRELAAFSAQLRQRALDRSKVLAK